MDFKNFLSNDKQLNESHFMDDRTPIVFGIGSLNPFHIGYIPMFAKMLELSEQHNAEPILTIVPNQSMMDDYVAEVVAELSKDYSFIKVMVERDVTKTLMKLDQYNRKPVAVLGEKVMVDKAIATCHSMNNVDVTRVSGYIDGIDELCMEAVRNDNCDLFRTYMVNSEVRTVQMVYEGLRGVYGKQ